MPIDLVITGIFIAISGRLEVLGLDIVINLLLLGCASVAGGWWLFKPIQAFLAGQGASAAAHKRIEALPRLACGWAVICTSAYCFAAASLGVFVPDLESLEPLPDKTVLAGAAWFGFLYALYYGFFIYFAVNDFVHGLKIKLSADGVAFRSGGRRFLHKLLFVFAVAAVIPSALIALDLTIFRALRAAQGLSIDQTIFLDLLASAFLITVSLIFVTRSLVRPINLLMSAMGDSASGRQGVPASIITNDELGVLAESYNNMLNGLRDREFIRETFGRFVPDKVAGMLLEQRGTLVPQLHEATILFADIQGFTTIVERHPPEQVLKMLNEYFSVASEPINRLGGVVNQFQGDGMLVTFNVPVADPAHADNAIAAAQEIQRIVSEREFMGIPVRVRIGISTGVVVAGAVGSDDRMSYTVHGEAVNLASRLEELNKQHGTRILVSGATVNVLKNSYPLLRIGGLDIRGMAGPVDVYSLGPVEAEPVLRHAKPAKSVRPDAPVKHEVANLSSAHKGMADANSPRRLAPQGQYWSAALAVPPLGQMKATLPICEESEPPCRLKNTIREG